MGFPDDVQVPKARPSASVLISLDVGLEATMPPLTPTKVSENPEAVPGSPKFSPRPVAIGLQHIYLRTGNKEMLQQGSQNMFKVSVRSWLARGPSDGWKKRGT